MKRLLRIIPVIFSGILVLGLALTPTYTLAATSVDQMIMSAKTKADHENLAKYYEDEAVNLKAQAAEHKKMAVSYRSLSTGKGGMAGFVAHCDRLVAKYEAMAADNEALAKLHHQFAAKLEN